MDTDNQSYLMFRHNESLYGVEAHRVREIFPLPELSLMADAPKDIIGSLNWRGKLLPVMHLDLRLGQQMQPCQLSDSVIVIDLQGIQIGMLVHQVLGVEAIAAAVQEAAPDYGRSQTINTAFVAGIAKVDSDLVMLLNLETLIRQANEIAMMIWEAELGPEPDVGNEADTSVAAQPIDVAVERGGTNFFERYCADITPEEQAIFRQRADDLRPSLDDTDSGDQMSLAVIGLGDDYFGLELDLVREFINVHQVTPIPCCPQHIVGNINLRGEVMTLVDIRTALNKAQSDRASTAQAIVVEVDDVIAGIPVDAVLDVMYLSPTDVTEIPMATPQRGYFQGTTQYEDKYLSIIDLPSLFSKGGLVVNQSV